MGSSNVPELRGTEFGQICLEIHVSIRRDTRQDHRDIHAHQILSLHPSFPTSPDQKFLLEACTVEHAVFVAGLEAGHCDIERQLASA